MMKVALVEAGGPVPFSGLRRADLDSAPVRPSGADVGVDRRVDEAARETRFRQLVDEHFEFVWRALRGLGIAPGAVDDAAQEVFWIAFGKMDTVVAGLERAFLFRTAIGVAANKRRSHGRSREVGDSDALARQPDEAPDPEQLMSMKQARTILDTVLDAMAEELKTVFILFELEEMTNAEIAVVLGLPPGTVASRLRRARDQFRRLMKRVLARTGHVSGRGTP
jgi:RNA polymerase sigma-70 factor (ECF subfamily)